MEISQQEYDHLVKRDLWLRALEDAGVDNWQGISWAYETLEEWENDPTV